VNQRATQARVIELSRRQGLRARFDRRERRVVVRQTDHDATMRRRVDVQFCARWRQPFSDLGVRVGVVVVEDCMDDLPAGDLALDGVEDIITQTGTGVAGLSPAAID
jgi:hypothetical protein